MPEGTPPSTAVSLIAGVASVLGAAFAWLQAREMTRLKGQADLQLEQLKIDAASPASV